MIQAAAPYPFGPSPPNPSTLSTSPKPATTASSNGWLVMIDETFNIYIFNPLTRARSHLPRIITIPEKLTKIDDVCFVRDYLFNRDHLVKLEEMDLYFDCYAFISSDPETTNVIDGVVTFKVAKCHKIQYWRPGDAAWTMLDLALDGPIATSAFYKGKLYVIDEYGNTAVCDLGSSEKVIAVSPLKLPDDHFSIRYRHLITMPDDLLLVTCWKDIDADVPYHYVVFPDMYFEYHKLDESECTMTWLELEDVGDCTVYMTLGAFQGKGKSISVSHSAAGYRRNSLCYVVPLRNIWSKDQQLPRMDVTIIERGRLEIWKTDNRQMKFFTWITPSLY